MATRLRKCEWKHGQGAGCGGQFEGGPIAGSGHCVRRWSHLLGRPWRRGVAQPSLASGVEERHVRTCRGLGTLFMGVPSLVVWRTRRCSGRVSLLALYSFQVKRERYQFIRRAGNKVRFEQRCGQDDPHKSLKNVVCLRSIRSPQSSLRDPPVPDLIYT